MAGSSVGLVAPVDGLDLLVDGGEFLLVRFQDADGERIRVGIRDATVRLLLIVRPRASRARLVLAVLAVMIAVAAAIFGASALGLPAILGAVLVVGTVFVGMFVIVLVQPLREYRFHDDLPGGRDRPPLMVLAERSGERSWYTLRDEAGRTFGDIGRRLGRWRVRGYEPIDPPDASEIVGGLTPEQERAVANLTGLAARLYAWGVALGEDEPTPRDPAPEVSATIVRDYLNWASLLGGLISGPLGLAMAFNGPWKRMEFRRGGSVVATGHRIDDGTAMRLEVSAGFDIAGPEGAWLDRRHLLALAALVLSIEADR